MTRDDVREIPIEVIQARPNMIRPIQAIRLQSIEREQQPPQFPSRESALLRESFGLTSEDLMNIQRLAQERIEHELRSLAQEDESNSSENSQDDDNSDENAMSLDQQLPINPQQAKTDEAKQDDDKSDSSKSNQVSNGFIH